MPVAVIECLDHEGRGVARVDGKTVVVEGALPGEEAEYVVYRRGPSHERARLGRLIHSSVQRVAPQCAHFDQCGGCSMQHLDPQAQTAVKQRMLEDALWEVAGLRPEIVYPAIHGSPWRYRERARIAVRLVPSKGGVRVGFHERHSSHIVDMRSCEVLPRAISAMLPDLRELVAGLSIPDRLPQIELAVAENATVLVFRNLVPLTSADEMRLASFADDKRVQVWLQPGGPDTAFPLHPKDAADLVYSLPEFGLTMGFRPTDFTQVNAAANRLLIRRSLQLLDPQPGERIADLFCGIGNFSLPAARSGAFVIGIEGSDSLVQRARENARRNGLEATSAFHAANLFETTEDSLAALGKLDKLLIDPPREGAIAVVKALGPDQSPARIVYVSCNPRTLARDAAVLVHQKAYALRGAGVVNMFPQTSHVESIAFFERMT